jgi:uncharacterized protein
MGKYTIGNFKLRVGRSRTGKGVFAREDIPKGACIVEYVGTPVSEGDKSRDRGKYLFYVSKKKTIDGNVRRNRARYINHSCRPNCEATGPNGRVFIMARRRIKEGEELTYDYGKEYFEQFIEPNGCRCAKCQPPAEPRGANGSRASRPRAASPKRATPVRTKPRSRAKKSALNGHGHLNGQRRSLSRPRPRLDA